MSRDQLSYTGSPENGGKFKYIMSIPRNKREVCAWKLCLYITSIRYPKMVFSRPYYVIDVLYFVIIIIIICIYYYN